MSYRSYTDVYFEQVGLLHMHYIFCHGQPIHGGRPMCALGQAIVCSQGERSPPLYVITSSKCFIRRMVPFNVAPHVQTFSYMQSLGVVRSLLGPGCPWLQCVPAKPFECKPGQVGVSQQL